MRRRGEDKGRVGEVGGCRMSVQQEAGGAQGMDWRGARKMRKGGRILERRQVFLLLIFNLYFPHL